MFVLRKVFREINKFEIIITSNALCETPHNMKFQRYNVLFIFEH